MAILHNGLDCFTVFCYTTYHLNSFLYSFFLQGGPTVAGRCWPFDGERGHLVLALSRPVTITHVTLGHISKTLEPTGTISTAPKVFAVYVSHKFKIVPLQTSCVFHCHIHGEQQGVQLHLYLSLLQGMKSKADEGTRLGTFLYDQDGESVQTFKLSVSITSCNETHAHAFF